MPKPCSTCNGYGSLCHGVTRGRFVCPKCKGSGTTKPKKKAEASQ